MEVLHDSQAADILLGLSTNALDVATFLGRNDNNNYYYNEATDDLLARPGAFNATNNFEHAQIFLLLLHRLRKADAMFRIQTSPGGTPRTIQSYAEF